MTNTSSANAIGLPAAPPPSPRREAKPPPSRRQSRKAFAAFLEAPPSALLQTPVYRALTLFGHVPPRGEAHLVVHDRFVPHIKHGEFVVIDTADREPVQGEIFLVKINSPLEPEGFVRKLVQLYRDGWTGEHWMMGFSIRRQWRRGLADGPLNERGMREKILGRVVGVIVPEAVR